MENEKRKLSVNIFYPVIILLFVSLILDNILSVVILLALLGIYLNYCLFPDNSHRKSDNFIRSIFFFVIMLTSMFAFGTIDLNWGVLNGSKIGVIFGFVLIAFLISYIKNRYEVELNHYHFDGSDNFFKDIELLNVILSGVFLFFLLSTISALFFRIFIFHYFMLISFLSVIVVTWQYAYRYGVTKIDIRDKKTNKYRAGIFLVLLGVYFVWLNVYTLIAITLVVLGLSYIQYVTTKENSDLQKKLLKKFSYPSAILLMFFISTNFLFNLNIDSATSSLMQPNEKLIYTNFENKRDKINKGILSLFDELKKDNLLVESIDPKVDIRLRTVNKWYLKKEVELVGDFSYNYEDQFTDTIHHYKPGRYRLKDSDISRAIVQAFKLTVENYFVNYFEKGTQVEIELDGAADAIPFSLESRTVYRGEYGERLVEEVYDYKTESYQNIRVNSNEKIDNPELAFLRSMGIFFYIDRKIPLLSNTDLDYKLNVFVEDSNVGPEYRRVRIFIKISDILI